MLVGGGMGMSHGRADTFAGLAEPLGFVETDNAVEFVRAVAGVFRDHGNRVDRKHARLKYLLAEWGVDRFRDEVRRRIAFHLHPSVPLPAPAFHDHLGRHPQGDGKWFYGIFVENGRVIDRDGYRIKSGLREVVERHRPGICLTSHQNLLITDLDLAAVDAIEQTLCTYGVTPVTELSAARRYSMACPALPTCGLAITESERAMPALVAQFEAELTSLGLRGAPITLRMTGCPNGCARPYTADIAFVGRKPERYNIYVGGGLPGDRVVDLFAEDVARDKFIERLRPLLRRWAAERQRDESFGDFYQRLVVRDEPRRRITGQEEPTQVSICPDTP
jgi:sulfite reductase beta subunit-like hemoprotein